MNRKDLIYASILILFFSTAIYTTSYISNYQNPPNDPPDHEIIESKTSSLTTVDKEYFNPEVTWHQEKADSLDFVFSTNSQATKKTEKQEKLCCSTNERMKKVTSQKQASSKVKKSCVFNSLYGIETIDSNFIYKTPQHVITALEQGLYWLVDHQHKSGGWSSGYYTATNVDRVRPDPSTTAMVCMSLMRNHSFFVDEEVERAYKKGIAYLIEYTQNINSKQKIHHQIISKLGQNIDPILTAQCLTNLYQEPRGIKLDRSVLRQAINTCLTKIESSISTTGIKGSGWAGNLQTSLALNTLEHCQQAGFNVSNKRLNLLKKNLQANLETEKVLTTGSGVLLYSVSGAMRSTSTQQKEVARKFKINEEKLGKNPVVSVKNLVQVGYSLSESEIIYTSQNVYHAAKEKMKEPLVVNGFGTPGGEEYISYLQTAESMIIAADYDWQEWYDNISGKLISTQQDDGRWQGHHCITSPAFCTATSVLILSLNNDIEPLVNLAAVH